MEPGRPRARRLDEARVAPARICPRSPWLPGFAVPLVAESGPRGPDRSTERLLRPGAFLIALDSEAPIFEGLLYGN